MYLYLFQIKFTNSNWDYIAGEAIFEVCNFVRRIISSQNQNMRIMAQKFGYFGLNHIKRINRMRECRHSRKSNRILWVFSRRVFAE
jgi:hypothetical protein